MKSQFEYKDLILGSDLITLTNNKGEVEINLEITKNNIRLNIAGREIEWYRKTGMVHSTGVVI